MTQTAAILSRLQAGETITPLDALRDCGSFRVGARIFELRRAGYQIETTRVHTPGGAIVAGYRLAKDATPPAIQTEPGQKGG
jgi:hypothetical protein